MRKLLAWTAVAGLVVSGICAGFQACIPANSAVVDGFSINTQDKDVTITLYTDQRLPYTTETQGRQFTIVLPNAQLSESQLNTGLPVVLDNKKRFIGRAVPTDDGQVKIILPNLPAEEYAVSIQQKRPQAQVLVKEPAVVTTAPKAVFHSRPNNVTKVTNAPGKPVENMTAVSASEHKVLVKPRAIGLDDSNASEAVVTQIANRFQKNQAQNAEKKQASGIHLSPVKDGTIWNPYLVQKQSPVPQQPIASASTGSDEPFSTVSVADSYYPPQTKVASASPQDPLWYLHSVPPANLGASIDNLQGLAKGAVMPPVNLLPTPAQEATKSESRPTKTTLDLRGAVLALPKWLLITLGLFLGGLGLFGVVGGVVLLKMLFTQTQPQVPTIIFTDPNAVMPTAPPLLVPQVNARNTAPVEKASYVSAPKPARDLFQDKAYINALDYLTPGTAKASRLAAKSPMSRSQRAMQQASRSMNRA